MKEHIFLVDPNLSPVDKAKACEQLEKDRYQWYEDYRKSFTYFLKHCEWELA